MDTDFERQIPDFLSVFICAPSVADFFLQCIEEADDSLAYHVSKKVFGELVERALAELPDQFAQHLEEVPIEIRLRPTREELKRLGLEEDELLLGLYDGIPLTQRSVEHSGVR